jgi:hypothetical protein
VIDDDPAVDFHPVSRSRASGSIGHAFRFGTCLCTHAPDW